MRMSIARCSVLLLAALCLAPAAARAAGLDQFKALAGEWTGRMEDGKPVSCSYATTAAGSCVMETLHTPDHGDMVTMYFMDGSRLTMDHYCSVGNQPRMRAEPSAAQAGVVNFKFVSATNLPSPDAPHMHGLRVHFVDADHFTQEWSMRMKGMDDVKKFEFERKK
jgi:hypothetical protein